MTNAIHKGLRIGPSTSRRCGAGAARRSAPAPGALLLLYASKSGPPSTASIAKGILAAPEVVDRWLDYLERQGLVETHPAKAALRLTDSGLSSLELNLRDRLQRAGRGSAPGKGDAGGLAGLRLALLLLATAILPEPWAGRSPPPEERRRRAGTR